MIHSQWPQICQLGYAVGKEPFLAAIIVHHEVGPPILQKGARMLPGAAGLVVEHDDGRPFVELVRTIGPEIGVPGFALSGSSWRTGV